MKWTDLKDFSFPSLHQLSWAGEGGEILFIKKSLRSFPLHFKLIHMMIENCNFFALKGHRYEVKGPQMKELTGTASSIFFFIFLNPINNDLSLFENISCLKPPFNQ